MDPVAAKSFLISKVVQQAEIDHVPLTEIERKMLYFTEVHPSLPDIYEVNAEFERTHNSDEYEARIAGLLKNARNRESRSSPSGAQEWKDALDALKNEDHYILVMVSQAFGSSSTSTSEHRFRDLLIYVSAGVGFVLVLVLLSFWKTHH